jgi:hypothetical protein
MKRKLLIILIFTLTGGAWVLPLRAQVGLALVPMRVEIQAAPGIQYTDSVRLSNDASEAVRVRAETLDFFIDDTLTPQFGTNYENEKSLSCRKWLQINPREFDLSANLTTRVRYTLQVPYEIPEGEYHCGAAFVTLPPIKEGEVPMGVRMAVRAVTSIYVIIGKPSSSPALKDLSLRNLSNGPWQVVALFENTGRRLFRISGFSEVQDAQGNLIERVEYPSSPVLPQRKQLFPLALKASLTPGTYTVHTQADVGLPTILEATTRVVVGEALPVQK